MDEGFMIGFETIAGGLMDTIKVNYTVGTIKKGWGSVIIGMIISHSGIDNVIDINALKFGSGGDILFFNLKINFLLYLRSNSEPNNFFSPFFPKPLIF
jgi:hypothetical protein